MSGRRGRSGRKLKAGAGAWRGRGEKVVLARAEVEVRIEEVGFGGLGIGRVQGKVWMVPFCLPGELVRARAMRERRDYVEGELLEVVEAAAERVEPPCRYFGVCGGCAYQHAAYGWQLEAKRGQVVALLARFGGRALAGRAAGDVVFPMIGSPVPLHYRNRLTVHVKQGRVGFYRWDGRGVVGVESCLLANAEVSRKLARLVGSARRLADGPRTLRARGHRGGFVQTNDAMAGILRNFVAGCLAEGSGVLLDVYGGSGFFAEAAGERFERVFVIDWSRAATEEARRKAVPHWTVIEADAAAGLDEAARWIAGDGEGAAGRKEIWAVVDPPAQGLGREVIERLGRLRLAGLVYVSCNPATFARDAGRLAAFYRLERVQPFDMFAQTAAIEVAGVFRGKGE